MVIPRVEDSTEGLIKEPHGVLMTPIFRKATAILQERNVDFLLPETALDVRFTRTLYYDLLEGREFSSFTDENSPLQSSLAKCVANIQYSQPISGHQPPMPSFCNLAIPKKLIKTPRYKRDNAPQYAEGETGTTEGEYIYPPLRSFTAASIARFNYKDLELNFSNPRMGPVFAEQNVNVSLAIGRYDDELRPLAIHRDVHKPASAGKAGDNSMKALFQPLYSRACQLAFELGAGTPQVHTNDLR
ncbi:predicted protein [Uncinocarpus reesii 1704]|uniref:SLS1 C-terminal domain-containing protein n=1 Tax=Uncinocarpus reesii (strain UAMH 1704) TaxID=336963 RepID=C4JK78_UNCRE|nr:uncharacterized protein UREG_02035 [Uncinocarpus reesii 1704]EEP77186.1 predicted protein [Uncinocarpus reesii 1704]